MILITPRDNSTDDVRMGLFILSLENDVVDTFTNIFIISTYVQLQYVFMKKWGENKDNKSSTKYSFKFSKISIKTLIS